MSSIQFHKYLFSILSKPGFRLGTKDKMMSEGTIPTLKNTPCFRFLKKCSPDFQNLG